MTPCPSTVPALRTKSSRSWSSVRERSTNVSRTHTPWRPGSSRSSPNSIAAGAARPPGAELADVERLREVVVGAGVEPVDAVLDPGPRRDHEDRHLVAGAAQAPAERQP